MAAKLIWAASLNSFWRNSLGLKLFSQRVYSSNVLNSAKLLQVTPYFQRTQKLHEKVYDSAAGFDVRRNLVQNEISEEESTEIHRFRGRGRNRTRVNRLVNEENNSYGKVETLYEKEENNNNGKVETLYKNEEHNDNEKVEILYKNENEVINNNQINNNSAVESYAIDADHFGSAKINENNDEKGKILKIYIM